MIENVDTAGSAQVASEAPAAPTVAEVLPIAGTVTASTPATPAATASTPATPAATAAPKAGKTEKTGKKEKRPFRLIRSCGLEYDLTEAEGNAFEAHRAWTRAETDATLRGQLEADQTLTACMFQVHQGTLGSYDPTLTPGQIETLNAAYRLWKQWAKQFEKDARRASDKHAEDAQAKRREKKQAKQQVKQEARTLAPLLETLERRGYTPLPDTVEGYAAVLLTDRADEAGAVALAYAPVGTRPVLLLATRPTRQAQDTAALLSLARRVPVPVGDKERRLDSPMAQALAPTELFLVGVIDGVQGREWTGSILPYAEAMKDAVSDALVNTLPLPITDPRELEFIRAFRQLDQAQKDCVEAILREAQPAVPGA